MTAIAVPAAALGRPAPAADPRWPPGRGRRAGRPGGRTADPTGYVPPWRLTGRCPCRAAGPCRASGPPPDGGGVDRRPRCGLTVSFSTGTRDNPPYAPPVLRRCAGSVELCPTGGAYSFPGPLTATPRPDPGNAGTGRSRAGRRRGLLR